MSLPESPCSGCGARLEFAPGQHALQCPHCGVRNTIEEAAEAARAAATEELDYAAFLAQAAGNEAMLERQTVRCAGCGATSQFAQNIAADRCAFCAAPLIAANAYTQRSIRPRAVIPFAIGEQAARTRFRDWMSGLWFAPNALREACRIDNALQGVYLPHWTYDAASDTSYSGERGEHYYVSERYVDNGQERTRQVQRTRWSAASGAVALHFDDIVVPASNSLPHDLLASLQPWQLGGLQPYRDDYLAGFTVEAYQVGLEPGFALARQHMEAAIREAIIRDIGGDEQRIAQMAPRFHAITFKHVLFPVWLASYRYGGKTWRFVVNGQTGKVQGERPWSAWKIALAAVAALLVLLVVFSLTGGR